jgi:hypothetical protein
MGGTFVAGVRRISWTARRTLAVTPTVDCREESITHHLFACRRFGCHHIRTSASVISASNTFPIHRLSCTRSSSLGDQRKNVRTVSFCGRLSRAPLSHPINLHLAGRTGETLADERSPLCQLQAYRMNLPTKGEVSPRRMKCPDGPSPRNSENHDSCSISSFKIASANS